MHYSHTEPPQDPTQLETPRGAQQYAAPACERAYGCIQMYSRVQKTFAHYRAACDVQRCFTEEEKTPPALRNKSNIPETRVHVSRRADLKHSVTYSAICHLKERKITLTPKT